jgi:hypothetical protein
MAKGKLKKILSGFCQFPFGPDVVCLCQFPFVHDIVCLCQFPFGHDVVCLLSVSLCPWYCMSFVSFHWQKTDNIMDKRKLTNDRQYHGHRETDKDRQYHGQRETDKRHTIFPLSIIFSVFSQFPFGHDIVWLLLVSLWPWCCLSLSVSLCPWY